MINHFEEAKNKLVLKASNFAARYLLGKYGSAHLIGTPKVELTATEGPTSTSFVFNGAITVVAASDGLLNQVGVNMTINENDIEVTSEDVQANISSALNAAEEHSDVVVASLDSFKLHDDGSKYLKLSHTALQDANLGIVGKNEWAASPDKSELLQGMVKDAMLENNISFVGEFKEPTIEKIASSVACPECGSDMSDLRDVCPKCEDESKSKKKAALIVDKQTAPKKSWLSDMETPSENEHNHNFGRIDEMGKAHCVECDKTEEELGLESSKTVAIKENMPMARATDHLAQTAQLEEQLISASSEKIKNEAANALIAMLQGMGYGSAKIAEVSTSKDGLDFMAAIDDGGAVKAVSIPVVIKEAKVILPKKSLVSTLISKGLDVKAKLAEQFDLDLLEKLAAIDEKMAYEAKEANDILADRSAAAVVKEAAGEKQPFFDSDDSTMTLNKHLLPDHEDYKVGDVLSDGTDEYEIVNTSGQQNDKNEGSSSQWTLKKRQAPARDDKEPKNKMPS